MRYLWCLCMWMFKIQARARIRHCGVIVGVYIGKKTTYGSFSHIFPCSHEAWRLSFVMHALLFMCVRCSDLRPSGKSMEASLGCHCRDTAVTVKKLMKMTTYASRFLPINVLFFLAGVNNYMWYNRITRGELHLRILINFRRPFICYEEGESYDNNCTE